MRLLKIINTFYLRRTRMRFTWGEINYYLSSLCTFWSTCLKEVAKRNMLPLSILFRISSSSAPSHYHFIVMSSSCHHHQHHAVTGIIIFNSSSYFHNNDDHNYDHVIVVSSSCPRRVIIMPSSSISSALRWHDDIDMSLMMMKWYYDTMRIIITESSRN